MKKSIPSPLPIEDQMNLARDVKGDATQAIQAVNRAIGKIEPRETWEYLLLERLGVAKRSLDAILNETLNI